MPAQVQKIDLWPYISIVFRRKWWIVFAFLFSITAGLGYYKLAPRTYQATTLILVEPQKVPDSYVEPVVSDTVESRLYTITQQIHSRTNLEKIIEQFRLDSKPENAGNDFIERIENLLRRHGILGGKKKYDQQGCPGSEAQDASWRSALEVKRTTRPSRFRLFGGTPRRLLTWSTPSRKDS